MTTYIEIFMTQYHQADQSFYYVREVLELSDVDPDHAVIDYLKQKHPSTKGRYISHSTSWHYKKPSQILLTYVVISEFFNLHNPVRTSSHLIAGGTWQKPRPKELKEEHILSHGLRHIAFLLRENTEPAWLKPQTLQALHEFQPSLAGEMLP